MSPSDQSLSPVPPWADGLPVAPLVALLLAGSWVPSVAGDRELMTDLGSDAEAVRAVGIELAQLHPPQVRQIENRWKRHDQPPELFVWEDIRRSWEQLADLLDDHTLVRFEAAVPRVLLSLGNAAKRGAAAIYSEGLAAGLTLSLALLGNSDGFVRVNPPPSTRSTRVVTELLRADGAWDRLAARLSLLAEAAPEAFLASLQRDLSAKPASGNPPGPSDSDAVARALAHLAWFEDLLEPVALALATLVERGRDALDSGSKSPALRCLADLFDVQDARTNAPIEQRLSLLRGLTVSHPQAAWRLLMALIPEPMRYQSPYAPPQVLRVVIPPRDRPAYAGEAYQQLAEITDLAGGLAESHPSRWAELIRAMGTLPPDLVHAILLRLEVVLPRVSDAQGKIWAALRHFLHGQQERGEAVAKASALYQQLTPQDLAQRWAWLFSVRPKLPDSYPNVQESRQAEARLRQQALDEIGQSKERWRVLGYLADRVDAPGLLARLLSQSGWADALEQQLLTSPSFAPLTVIAPDFLAWRFVGRAPQDTELLLRRWVAEGRQDDVVRLTVSMSGGADQREVLLWDLLDQWGEPLLSSYWRSIASHQLEANADRRSIPATERALRALLRCGRAFDALAFAEHRHSELALSLRIDLLEQVADRWHAEEEGRPVGVFRPPSQEEVILRMQLATVLTGLTPETPEQQSRLQAVERKLLSILPLTPYRLRFLPKLIAEDPAALVSLADRSLSWYLTETWKGFPGEDLPAVQGQKYLLDWSRKVLRALPPEGTARYHVLDALAALVVRPTGSDDNWPGEAFRQLLKDNPSDELKGHLHAALCNANNSRRARPVAELAKRAAERALRCREFADRLEAEWPETSALLRQAASFFDDEVKRSQERDELDGWSPPMTSKQMATQPLFPLSHLRVSGFRIIKECEQDLHPRLNVVFGRNASGKTSLLDAIAIGLSALARRLPRTASEPERDLKFVQETDRWEGTGAKGLERAKVVRVSLWAQALDEQREPLHWQVENRYARGPEVGDRENPQLQPYLDDLNEALRTSQSHIAMPVFAYYGVERSMSANAEAAPPERAILRTSGLEGALQGAARFERTVKWFRGLEDQEVRKRLQTPGSELPELHAVRSAVKAAVRDEFGAKVDQMWVVPERNQLRVKFVRPDGSAHELDATRLSDGFRTQLALVMDLALRMAICNPVPEGERSLDGFGIRSHSLVLIDEVDLHLHPGWQKTVLPGLLEAFPRTQFIVTTHSVLTLGSVQDAQLFLMENGQTECIAAPYGKDASLILREYQGTVPRVKEIDDRISELKALLQARDFAAARPQIDRLEEQLGSDDPDVQTLRTLLFFMDPRKPSAGAGGGESSKGSG